MRRRFAARIIMRNASGETLLMHYSHKEGILKGNDFWSLPGGEVEDGELIDEAARRELFEETGVACLSVGEEIAIREFEFLMPDGERVLAEEHSFNINVSEIELSTAYLTSGEKKIVTEYRWWSQSDLQATAETIYPTDIVMLISTLGL